MASSIRLVGEHVADEVEHQDHQDGQAPHAVQHRQVSMQVGARAGARRGREVGWLAADDRES